MTVAWFKATANRSQRCWPNHVESCCVRLHVAKGLTSFKTLRNNSQQHATNISKWCVRVFCVVFWNVRVVFFLATQQNNGVELRERVTKSVIKNLCTDRRTYVINDSREHTYKLVSLVKDVQLKLEHGRFLPGLHQKLSAREASSCWSDNYQQWRATTNRPCR